ncbi:YslB family protein [Halalkalibacterium halodurans]|jgi:predicted hydrocarbon binding protein|uniref:BH3095 protein n=2 Tax=Halalkalibacterium halodurans TaxID=86665 RepID=Q9K8B1_HALH5|nr:YslB family protein [Halalkalibacterium halodurans]MDY7223635.1 YslB family protein [Halalkalibacterium halodurans]MDY7242856.1 YslB family protein [Halalkalibacterium halodurans]MED3645704.1 YslB family protein [Halalkalibacterium halodurans]MED4082078.1 YslB family protein [Halalkalibacterium halodurans]MED4084344.1 YslB family protein [Halalkalibacterium halodurans]
MSTKEQETTMETVQLFGYDLLRNDVLREILGSEHDAILYWVGKSLARKHPIETMEETFAFFEKANWGQLSILKQKRQEYTFELQGPWMTKSDQRCYQLEAGFLAQLVQNWSETIAEATYVRKRGSVLIDVHTDKGDSV